MSRRIERWLSIRREVVAGRKGECCIVVMYQVLKVRTTTVGVRMVWSWRLGLSSVSKWGRAHAATAPNPPISGSGTEGDDKIQALAHKRLFQNSVGLGPSRRLIPALHRGDLKDGASISCIRQQFNGAPACLFDNLVVIFRC